MSSRGFASNYRIVLLSAALFGCFVAVGFRLVWLHSVNRDEYLGNIAKARRQLIIEKARRGSIYDSRGALLATSSQVWQLGVDPQALRKEDEKRWGDLADLIDLPESEVRRIFTTKYRTSAAATNSTATASSGSASTGRPGLVLNFNPPGTPAPAGSESEAVGTDVESEPVDNLAALRITTAPAEDDTETDDADENDRRPIKWAKLKDEISDATYEAVKKLNIKGVYATASFKRVYPHHQLGAHVVGFVDRAQRPMAGVERFADFYLRGQDGWREGERDGKAKELPQFSTRAVEHIDGYNVTLSLDSQVQNIIERELVYIDQTFAPKKATIIVSDARTGFILGLANTPTFNPNEYFKLKGEELRRFNNVAVSDVYDPGSVFKIVAASGALNEHLVTPQSIFDCSITKIEYKGLIRSLPDEAHRFTSNTSVAEIISHSSNRGAAQLAMQLGDERFYKYAASFGFGARTGLLGSAEVDKSLRGLAESRGKLMKPSEWDGLTITRMPMGHSVSVTVLQMHQAMGVIASGGVLLEPQLVRNIRDNAGNIVYEFGRQELHRAITPATASTMAQLLMGCVAKDGTAPLAAIPGYEVAGKTGTTQKYMPDGPMMANGKRKLLPSKTHHVSSFVGFFPASNPRVVISVIVDDADARSPGGAGGKIAAPSFRKIGEQLIPILDIKVGNNAGPVLPTSLVALQGVRP